MADLHLGLRFQNHPEARDTLIRARYDTLEKLVGLANEKRAEILVIAGDLFDKTSMKVLEMQQAVQMINQFEGDAVLVLPGNHDYIAADSPLWDRFRKEAGENVRVLDKKEAIDLADYNLNVVVYPAPCHAKHSAENSIGWVKTEEKDSGKVHLGIAHGSIEGVSPDFEQRYFPMTVRELTDAGVDLWLMGHTHITWPENPGKKDIIFNPGTPEPDGFDCRHEGRAFLHTIDPDKTIRTQTMMTGSYRFLSIDQTLRTRRDLEELVGNFQNEEYQKSVVKLSVSGRLDPDVYDEWIEMRQQIRNTVLELKLDDADLKRNVSREQIRNEFTEGSFPERLLSSIPGQNESELQMAYELLREVKQ